MPKIPFWIFIILAAIHFTAVRVDVMDVDASQYAEISREMMTSGDYLHVYDRGRDYLDKPPFLFWVSALSMKVFGVNNFGYKLPSILFALWALYAAYRLARLLYDEKTGRMAALVLGCCQGMFLMTNDIRTDTILMSWTITAIWLIKEWDVRRKLQYLLLGSAAIAFGMMTKGPIALMVPVFCFASDWALKREWKKFFQPEYLLSIVVIAILLIPMCIGLYQQFDMHPEKIIDGKTGTSGLRFFFWTQSFGRITGENTWDNGAPFRIDANEAFNFEEIKKMLPELEKLGVNMIEQPLSKSEWEAMKELKAVSSIPLFADESCVTEEDVKRCAECFHGINIKLTKCGGITPALRMIQEAKQLGLKLMIGSMNESTVGSAAIAHLMPLVDEADVDGPLLLKEDVAEGLNIESGAVSVAEAPGLGVRFWTEKRLK